MGRVQLFYKDMGEIVGSDGFSVVRLTDADEVRAICVICDKLMTDQLTLRIHLQPGREQMLPEVLLRMLLADNDINDFEMMVSDVCDGQYRVTLLNKRTLTMKLIRMSDAVLLSVISRIPLYIDDTLMQRQSTPYNPDVRGISVPINTIGLERLNQELDRAIEAEDYRLASYLHEEILRRDKK